MKIESHIRGIPATDICLNPYSNGMKIELTLSSALSTSLKRLNPYSNGMKIEFIEGRSNLGMH